MDAKFCVLPPITTQLLAFKVFSFSHPYVAPETEVPLIPVWVPEQIVAGVVRLPELGAEQDIQGPMSKKSQDPGPAFEQYPLFVYILPL